MSPGKVSLPLDVVPWLDLDPATMARVARETEQRLMAEGGAAFWAGLPITKCPPFRFGDMAWAWRQGWRNAKENWEQTSMRIDAPWNDGTVKALNAYQRIGHFHPFTCPHAHDSDRELIATTKGWVCRQCGYTQSWALSGAVDIGRRVAV